MFENDKDKANTQDKLKKSRKGASQHSNSENRRVLQGHFQGEGSNGWEKRREEGLERNPVSQLQVGMRARKSCRSPPAWHSDHVRRRQRRKRPTEDFPPNLHPRLSNWTAVVKIERSDQTGANERVDRGHL